MEAVDHFNEMYFNDYQVSIIQKLNVITVCGDLLI